MDFVDSFSNLHDEPLASLVEQFYHQLNRFITGENRDFLDLWHQGPESVLYFNLDERERGGENIRRCWTEIQRVLSKAPVKVEVKPLQITFHQSGDLAYAVTMERSVADVCGRHLVTDEHRATICWRRFDKEWKVVHYHEDLYTRRNEALSELLRSYERQPTAML